MAGVSKEKQLSQHVYGALQTASCPLVEGLYLREADSMQELLCTPSQHRTDILAWICSSISPSINRKLSSLRSKEPDALTQELAGFGQEMMLCKADDLDLITGQACPLRQLRFMEQLLTLVPGCVGPTEGIQVEGLLRGLFSPESLPHLTHILTPTLNPWPSDIRARWKGQRSLPSRPRGEEAAEVTALLQSTRSTLEQLQSECEFLSKEALNPSVFNACALRVAVSDLAQLMSAFSRVYNTDFQAYCDRAPPSLSTETPTFSRIHQLLLACNTELEVLQQLSEASTCLTETVSLVHTQPRYWSQGEKHTLPVLLEELMKKYKDFLSLHHNQEHC